MQTSVDIQYLPSGPFANCSFFLFIKIYGFNNPISSFTTHDVYVHQEIVFQHKIYNIIYKETTRKIYFPVEKSITKTKKKKQ